MADSNQQYSYESVPDRSRHEYQVYERLGVRRPGTNTWDVHVNNYRRNYRRPSGPYEDTTGPYGHRAPTGPVRRISAPSSYSGDSTTEVSSARPRRRTYSQQQGQSSDAAKSSSSYYSRDPSTRSSVSGSSAASTNAASLGHGSSSYGSSSDGSSVYRLPVPEPPCYEPSRHGSSSHDIIRSASSTISSARSDLTVRGPTSVRDPTSVRRSESHTTSSERTSSTRTPSSAGSVQPNPWDALAYRPAHPSIPE